jgi:Family of unknown function (DUF6228)
MTLADYPAAIQLRGMPPRTDPQLVLSDPVDPDQGGYVLSFRAELTAAGLTATADVVVAQDHDDLDAFFDRLVARWRGWQGEQVWEALEHQMSIAASHDGLGHVRLRVTLRQDHLPDRMGSQRDLRRRRWRGPARPGQQDCPFPGVLAPAREPARPRAPSNLRPTPTGAAF